MNSPPTSLLTSLSSSSFDSSDVEVVVAPPSVYLKQVKDQVAGSKIEVAAQNCYIKASGAFTGEISPAMILSVGATWVILGHSERRTILGESSQFVAEKTKAALEGGLRVILCIGESLDERKGSLTDKICQEQLTAVISVLKEDDWKNIVIAYEPIWAIGTGLSATPEIAQETQAAIRAFLSKSISPAVAESTRILYGGSVSKGNCKDLAKQQDIDGFLVGGASLKDEFLDIVRARA